jgi:hypothetical protein
VVRVHITKKGELPASNTVVLRTPECSGTVAGWIDSSTVAVVYDSLSANSFFSGIPGKEVRTLLIDRKVLNVFDARLRQTVALPCDPY